MNNIFTILLVLTFALVYIGSLMNFIVLSFAGILLLVSIGVAILLQKK